MSEEKKKPADEAVDKDQEPDSETVENLEAVGQIILGEVEKVGGIIMADPIAQAEGDYNIEVGTLHQKVNKELHSNDEDPEPDEEE